jgi:pimeloyl-ACP methyl ester carboxylesterase
MRSFLPLSLCLAACAARAPRPLEPAPPAPPSLTLEPHRFTARDGRAVDAEIGRFAVPENRSARHGRSIQLAFVRFRSTAARPGNPIVYLAGGPGGAGTAAARGRRFDVFQTLRAQADVIAFDQRGTGLSDGLPDCEVEPFLTPGVHLTRATIVAKARADLRRCLDRWRGQGIDVDAYDTRESAADLEDLRRAIRAERIDLWAISYGTHLGAAYLREHEDRVGRALFAGYEGPGDTVKRPSWTDGMLARLAAVVAADPAVGARVPDLVGLMRRVLARLETRPAPITVERGGRAMTVLLGAFPLQMVTGMMIADPDRAAHLPGLYTALDRGEYASAAAIIALLADEGDRLAVMPTAMDVASGITAGRLAEVNREARRAVLGDALNFPMPHVLGVAPELDLGDAFRAPLKVRTPILFLSGTLDGRTDPAAVRAALPFLPGGSQLVVDNGGHNLYEADPRIGEIALRWFRDGVAPARLALAPPLIPALP